MTLLSSSRSNIKRSIDGYFNQNLSDTFSIHWEGLPFNNTTKSEWLMPRIIEFITNFKRQGSGTQYGDDIDIIFSIGIFVKKSNITIGGREYAIRDIIAGYFKVGKVITIYDYSGDGSTNVGKMKVRDIITDNILPESNDLYNYNLTYLINATVLTTNPT